MGKFELHISDSITSVEVMAFDKDGILPKAVWCRMKGPKDIGYEEWVQMEHKGSCIFKREYPQERAKGIWYMEIRIDDENDMPLFERRVGII